MEIDSDYQVVFFAGGETRDNKFNVFTGTFIEYLTTVMNGKFRLIKGIYFRFPMLNVAWGLNNAQKPVNHPSRSRIISAAFNQLIRESTGCNATLIMLSSSAGSIIAAQAACYLASMNHEHHYFERPFHLVLGTNFISKESFLFKKLLEYQAEGQIGKLIFDELQDEGDSVYQAGGTTRSEAWKNAFGLMFPWFSGKFTPPSFLNTHPENGHLHRKRSQSVQKAKDFINIIFIHNNLAGDFFKEKARELLSAN